MHTPLAQGHGPQEDVLEMTRQWESDSAFRSAL